MRVWLWRGHLIPYVVAPCRGQSAASPPDVVLVHGFGAFGEHFRGAFASLADSCTVFAPTFPGFGRAEKGALPYSQVLWTEYLRDFIEARLGLALAPSRAQGCPVSARKHRRLPCPLTVWRR